MGIHLLDAVPPRIGPGIDEVKGDVENFVPLQGGCRRMAEEGFEKGYSRGLRGFHKLKSCSELFGCGSEKKTPCLTKKHDAPNDSPAPPAEFNGVMRICTRF